MIRYILYVRLGQLNLRASDWAESMCIRWQEDLNLQGAYVGKNSF